MHVKTLNKYQILVGKPIKKSLATTRLRRENVMKMNVWMKAWSE